MTSDQGRWTPTISLIIIGLLLILMSTRNLIGGVSLLVQTVLLTAFTLLHGSRRLDYLTGERTTVTDALGQTWRTADIYETSVLNTIYGMVFITVLAALSLARRRSSNLVL